ncbi:hypothetical protein TeGR_g10348 [Tetraparma gracilis]|uniref:Uncharacterized protein n=1 Tax=Tetraparma gracilis TaxID=2962635 RepID=A0ABQ6MT03_9STRA|nr:hypothetical protein TeGR_g10348 [Tetraparma gracilis]
MITYRRSTLALLFCTLNGSPFPPSLLLALLSSCVAVAAELLLPLGGAAGGAGRYMEHPYPFQLFAAVVGFGLVFRARLAYERYWEGRTALASMGAKWTDAALQVRSFSSRSPSLSADAEWLDLEVSHLLSLAHALSLQQLRGDACNRTVGGDDRNLEEDKGGGAPSEDVTEVLGGPRKFYHLFISANNNNRRYLGDVFALNKLPVLGGVTPSERALLFRPPLTGNERVPAVLEAVSRLITEAVRRGVIDAPGPIVSRTFQVLSEGHERGVMMSRKVGETPFPLPFAQVIEFLVTVFVATLPFILSTWLDSAVFVGLANFLTAWSYLALNEVARMLEEPFGADSNDLPLCFLQWEFNRRVERSAFAVFGGGWRREAVDKLGGGDTSASSSVEIDFDESSGMPLNDTSLSSSRSPRSLS